MLILFPSSSQINELSFAWQLTIYFLSRNCVEVGKATLPKITEFPGDNGTPRPQGLGLWLLWRAVLAAQQQCPALSQCCFWELNPWNFYRKIWAWFPGASLHLLHKVRYPRKVKCVEAVAWCYSSSLAFPRPRVPSLPAQRGVGGDEEMIIKTLSPLAVAVAQRWSAGCICLAWTSCRLWPPAPHTWLSAISLFTLYVKNGVVKINRFHTYRSVSLMKAYRRNEIRTYLFDTQMWQHLK